MACGIRFEQLASPFLWEFVALLVSELVLFLVLNLLHLFGFLLPSARAVYTAFDFLHTSTQYRSLRGAFTLLVYHFAQVAGYGSLAFAWISSFGFDFGYFLPDLGFSPGLHQWVVACTFSQIEEGWV